MPRPNRRAELLRAAAEEFREHGYDTATLEGIGARVGILKGSVYTYVASKEELLDAVIEPPARQLAAALDRLAAERGPVTQRLRTLVREQVRIFAEHHPAAFVHLAQVGRPGHRHGDLDARYLATVEALLVEGAAAGEFSLAAGPGTTARAITGMLGGMQHWFVPRGAAADGALADDLFAVAMGGLVAGGATRALLDGLRDAAGPGGPGPSGGTAAPVPRGA